MSPGHDDERARGDAGVPVLVVRGTRLGGPAAGRAVHVAPAAPRADHPRRRILVRRRLDALHAVHHPQGGLIFAVPTRPGEAEVEVEATNIWLPPQPWSPLTHPNVNSQSQSQS